MKKGMTLLLTAAIAFGSASALYAEDTGDDGRISTLEAKVDELENRISQLELLLSGSGGQLAELTTPFTLASGIYIGGEDIPVGDYSFKVTSGTGQFTVYSSYDEYLEDEYNYKNTYLLMDESAKNALITGGMEVTAATYTTELGNIKITDGLCISVEGLVLEGSKR